MADLPPLMRDQRRVDVEHLKILAIFHFVFAGLAVVGIAFLGLHYFVMSTVFGNAELWQHHQGAGPPPQEFLAVFQWFYAVFGVSIAACGVGNLLSGIFLRTRTHRVFSLIVAALNCMNMPFGTILGVFTIVVLLRDSVRELYET
jgi:hypothetical protein